MYVWNSIIHLFRGRNSLNIWSWWDWEVKPLLSNSNRQTRSKHPQHPKTLISCWRQIGSNRSIQTYFQSQKKQNQLLEEFRDLRFYFFFGFFCGFPECHADDAVHRGEHRGDPAPPGWDPPSGKHRVHDGRRSASLLQIRSESYSSLSSPSSSASRRLSPPSLPLS